MTIRTTILLVAVGASFGSACSLLLPFNPEGQPCDALGQCLEGFGCVDGFCKEGAETTIDCSRCPAGACIPGTNSCLPNTCQYKICQAGFECIEDSGGAGPQCRVIVAGASTLGFGPCFTDNDCFGSATSVRHCMLGAIPTQTTGGIRGGICVEECSAEDTCATTGAVCRSFTLGADAGVTKVCLPTNTVTACTSSKSCERADFVCTVFDHPKTGPLEACDAPMPSGAKTGQGCVRRNDDGGTLCESGLCIPDPATSTNRNATCGETCDLNTCVGQVCAPAEYQIESSGSVIRYVPMCIPQLSNCTTCAADPTGACKADAPHCVAFNGESRCLGACSPDAGAFQCPADYQCSKIDAGTFCTPLSGACP